MARRGGDWARGRGLHAKKLERAAETRAEVLRMLTEVEPQLLACVPPKAEANAGTMVECIRDSFSSNIAAWDARERCHTLMGGKRVTFGRSWLFPHLSRALVGKYYVFTYLSRNAGEMTSSMVVLK